MTKLGAAYSLVKAFANVFSVFNIFGKNNFVVRCFSMV